MTHARNSNKINEPSLENVYRFPSWYRPKPVQDTPQTGTDPVSSPASQTIASGQSYGRHPEPVPEMGTGNITHCTGNVATLTHTQETQLIENIGQALASAPEVPDVPVPEREQSPVVHDLAPTGVHVEQAAHAQEPVEDWSAILEEDFWVSTTVAHTDVLHTEGQVAYLPDEIRLLREMKGLDPATFPVKLLAIHQVKQIFGAVIASRDLSGVRQDKR